jgi:diguanylate cyclase (GGDEF)-like protein/PAS domain S-box-containing protein
MPISWDYIPDGLLVVGDDGEVVEANRAAGALFGTGVAPLMGRRAESLIASDLDTLRYDELVRDRIKCADGTPIPVDVVFAQAGSQRLLVVRRVPQGRLLEEMRATLDVAFDSTPLCAALFNSEGQYIRVNDNLCRLLGRPPDALIGRRDQEFTHPEDRPADLAAARRILNGELDTWQTEKRFLRPDGSVVWVIANLTFLRDQRGGPLGWLGQFQDITDRRATEAQLRDQERLLRAGFDGAAIGMALVQPDGRCIRVNRALCTITGYSEEQLVGDRFQRISHPDDIEHGDALVQRALAGEIPAYEVEKRYIHARGHEAWVHLSVALVRNEAGEPLYFVSQVQDIGQRKRYETELERLAAQDPLTGLLNQRVFRTQLHTEDARAARYGRALSVALLDLDHFKLINDRYGHPVGDQVLIELARRLDGLKREGEYLARVGGEEFAWILPDADGLGAYAAVERARAAISAVPFPDVGSLTISAGICERAEAACAEQMYARADKALYWAKHHGRNQTFTYTAQTAAYFASDDPMRRTLSS